MPLDRLKVEARAARDICGQLESCKDHLAQDAEAKSAEIDELLEEASRLRVLLDKANNDVNSEKMRTQKMESKIKDQEEKCFQLQLANQVRKISTFNMICTVNAMRKQF